MTHDEIINGMGWLHTVDLIQGGMLDRIKRLVETAEAREREACAKVCKRVADEYVAVNGLYAAEIADECAVEIRARGK